MPAGGIIVYASLARPDTPHRAVVEKAPPNVVLPETLKIAGEFRPELEPVLKLFFANRDGRLNICGVIRNGPQARQVMLVSHRQRIRLVVITAEICRHIDQAQRSVCGLPYPF